MVESQTLKLIAWEPNFNPETQKTSSAFVWIFFPGLSIEYWKEGILLQLGRAIKVDEVTLKKEIGYYASVLVEVDFAKFIPAKVIVEYKYGKFEQAIQISKKPKFCNHCSIVGHLTTECRAKRTETTTTEKVQEVLVEKPKKQWRQKVKPPRGFDICFTPTEKETDHIIEHIEVHLLSENEMVDAIIPHIQKTGEARFHILQDKSEEFRGTLNSHDDFPLLSVDKIITMVSSAPPINNVVNILPPIGIPVTQTESIPLYPTSDTSTASTSNEGEDIIQEKHTATTKLHVTKDTSTASSSKE
ncbi:uncharacterized protein LOC113273179 [Papaver somniferum]|uniref:uncharacterized protein LOC113273179 n=1 Tax=Papaver somniferum TaxID=3469 RepID=UPI000E6FEF2C|nr:uncharacterized protein LOC113273179 [Papaver somniferum]